MINTIAMIAAAAAAANADIAPPAPDFVVQEAVELARAQKYELALAHISTLSEDDANSYDARFAEARILAWAGRHEEAETVYMAALEDYPDDPDLKVGYGQLAYYQGDYAKSIDLLKPVVAAYPEYKDAVTTLDRAYAARQSTAASDNSKALWRLDYGGQVSTFERSANENWARYFAHIARSKNGKTFSFEAQRFERFGVVDTGLTIGAHARLGDGWDGSVQFEVTPDPDFRPSFGFDVETGRTFNGKNGEGPAFRPYIRYSYDDYPAGAIHTLFPGGQIYWRNGVSLDVRLITVFQRTEDTQIGASARVSLPISEKWKTHAGYADAPEAINGVVVRTKTVFGGIQYDVNDKFAVKANYARDDRENSFIRNVFSVSISHRF